MGGMSKNGQTPDTATDSEPDMIHPNEYKRRWFVWATAKAQKLAAEGFGLGKIMESLHLSGYEWWEIKRVGGIKIKKCPCGSVSARWAGIDWTQRGMEGSATCLRTSASRILHGGISTGRGFSTMDAARTFGK